MLHPLVASCKKLAPLSDRPALETVPNTTTTRDSLRVAPNLSFIS